jgi:hypothetical protein
LAGDFLYSSFAKTLFAVLGRFAARLPWLHYGWKFSVVTGEASHFGLKPDMTLMK